jgi:hypothetical protein
MTDVVIKLPVKDGREAELFGDFLNRFIENSSSDAAVQAADSDAPYLMVRSDPQPNLEMKVLIFQQSSAAVAFSDGWAEACGSLNAVKVGRQAGL